MCSIVSKTCCFRIDDVSAANLRQAIGNRHLECMNDIIQKTGIRHGIRYLTTFMQEIIRKGDLDSIVFLTAHGYTQTHLPLSYHLEDAVRCGQFEVLKYLYENWGDVNRGYLPNKYHMNTAMEHGCLEIVMYFHGMGVVPSVHVFETLSGRMQMECVRYLIEHGYAYNRHLFKTLETESWFQMHLLRDKNMVTERNFSMKRAVVKIQRMWLRYAYNPESPVGRRRMMQVIRKNQNEVANYFQTKPVLQTLKRTPRALHRTPFA
jgi:hypothetical protein